MSACSTTSLGGIIKTKRSAVITHRSADQDVGAGVVRAGKSLGHAMKRAAWVLQVLGMHRLTGWCTCCRESGFRETHKLEINEVQKKKGRVQYSTETIPLPQNTPREVELDENQVEILTRWESGIVH